MRSRESVFWRVGAVAAVVLAVSWTGVVAAQGQPNDGNAGGDLDAGVAEVGPGEYESSLRYGAERRSIGSSDSPCSYEVRDYAAYEAWWQALPQVQTDSPPTDPDDPANAALFERDWVIVYCTNGAGVTTLLDGFQLGDPPDPGPLVEHARRTLAIPLPAPAFSPDPTAGAPQVVGLETWLWVEAPTTADQGTSVCLTTPEGAAFACASVDAAFLDTGFAMGDASAEVFCEGAGVPYDPDVRYAEQAETPHCAHVYLDADPGGSTYEAVATTFWWVTWECTYDAGFDGTFDGSCGGGAIGVVGRSQAPVPLDVLDLQARAVPTSG